MCPLHILLLLLLLLLPLPTPAWHRASLGRVLWAQQTSPETAIISTQANLISLISLQTGFPLWRHTPHSKILQISLCTTTSPPTLLLALATARLQALSAQTGILLWEAPGCTFSIADDLAAAHPCNTSSPPVWLDIPTGGPASIPPEASPVPAYDIPASQHVSVWQLSSPPSLSLHSAPDGALTLRNASATIWAREEGVSHPISSALLHPPSGPSVLVVLSALHAVFGLNAAVDGSVLWKVPLDAESCALVAGRNDVVAVACRDANATIVTAVRAQTGDVVLRDIVPGFAAHRAAMERAGCCARKDVVCVRLVDQEGAERLVSSEVRCTPREGEQMPRGWLEFEAGGSEVRLVRDGFIAWQVSLPPGAAVASVGASRAPHPSSRDVRPPAVRVTGARRMLFPFVDPDVALVLAENRDERVLHAIIVDVRTGSVISAVTHERACGPVVAVKGDSWFVYAFWSEAVMWQEVHVVDLYHSERTFRSAVSDAVRAAGRRLVGEKVLKMLKLGAVDARGQCRVSPDGSDGAQCAADNSGLETETPKNPVIIRSSMLATRRIVGLDVTETELGITEPSVVMTLESGQVTLVSKILLDARRPKNHKLADPMSLLFPYSPWLELHSISGESSYVFEGKSVVGLIHVALAPMPNRESQTQIAVVGTDIICEVVQPVGAFDSLPPDFMYSAVIGMLACLSGALLYTQQWKTKAILSRSW